MKNILICGGGTGGHIYPAIAIAHEIRAREPRASVTFVGTEYGLETKLVPKAGYPLEFISIGGLKGKNLLLTLRNAARIPWAFVQAWRLLSRIRPDAVVGVGGYASGPVVMVAAMRGIPTMIHEQNAYPGITNRLLAKVVRQIAVAFPEALEVFQRPGVVTGNPIRREFFEAAARTTGAKKRILVFGGSQGSKILNDAMTGALLFLAHIRDQIEIVHQTGPKEHARVESAYKASAFVSSARVVPFLDPMAVEMAAADLVISRSGAMTVGELAATGRPSILVPFALATNNHQEMNARVLERTGAAVVITEKELTPEKLAGVISAILADEKRLAEMGAAARSISEPQATAGIVDLLQKTIGN